MPEVGLGASGSGLAIIAFTVGLVLLLGGAEALVRSAGRLAGALGIAPLAVGMTVVALATSAPELAVTLRAVFGAPEELPIALGNVIGSNIANTLLILGISALLIPLAVASSAIRRDIPIVLAASCAVPALALLGTNGPGLGLMAGLVLTGGLVAWLTLLLVQGDGAVDADPVATSATLPAPAPPGQRSAVPVGRDLVQLALGAGLLILGAHLLVAGAADLARALGLGELLIGLTVVAVGTSLPELVTSVVAAFRGERDLAVGNVVGSNLLNLLAVLGISSLLAPEGIAIPAEVLRVDFPVLIGTAALCLVFCLTSSTVSRGEGFLLLLYYALYIGDRVLDTVAPALRAVWLTGSLIVVAVTLSVAATAVVRRWWLIRSRRSSPG